MKWFINCIFWLQAFAAPVILAGLIGLITSSSGKGFIIILSAGAVLGILLAEYIRRKYGLDVFFARIYSSNKMDRQKNNTGTQ